MWGIDSKGISERVEAMEARLERIDILLTAMAKARGLDPELILEVARKRKNAAVPAYPAD